MRYRCEKKTISWWVAIDEKGNEYDIKGVDEKDLKHGIELEGEYCEDDVQIKYTDGTYSRSYQTFEWIQVKKLVPCCARCKNFILKEPSIDNPTYETSCIKKHFETNPGGEESFKETTCVDFT